MYVCMYVCKYTHIHACLGAESGFRSWKENSNMASSEELSKRCPQNAMTRNPFHVWPNAVMPYIFDAFISKCYKGLHHQITYYILHSMIVYTYPGTENKNMPFY